MTCGRCKDIHTAQKDGKTQKECKCDCHNNSQPDVGGSTLWNYDDGGTILCNTTVTSDTGIGTLTFNNTDNIVWSNSTTTGAMGADFDITNSCGHNSTDVCDCSNCGDKNCNCGNQKCHCGKGFEHGIKQHRCSCKGFAHELTCKEHPYYVHDSSCKIQQINIGDNKCRCKR